ncbi:N-acyl-phosphatidylethanolamine-hydrolyzing phospholipase D [Kwoniella mangroviensis CBS 10435]|uniref:N-acyl-phosphatidylethanolamine-hydrolyzing phospholipase D n=1 Tax=Kwoniella mangroviensis CBS 10435 TaxID=1331196 RepID=A0A1B9IYE0_9TREE|nr:N-acyl-phosphatidylethanolamine-hydrolyzing phospholipase D [Kwoniella mangroviensis CBS 10435]OCF74706.1 N-acyl-phosphatidylethanolamine-hydrolyzing phospholipase D [Kwoniella mangroviensis CBS 8886]
MSSHPIVSIIPPPRSLPKDHHGPFQSSKQKSKSKTKSPIEEDDEDGCHNPTYHKPKYFKNPWPSYRTASLHDAYLAYQLGAAVALPPHQTPGSSKLGLTDQEPYDEDGNDDPREEDGSLRAETDSMIPKRLYIRPDFSEVKEDDEFDDWREPPVRTVEPTWLSSSAAEEGGEDRREKVTWLGHAGVLIRVPFKDRIGYAGVIFDPIFSYRCSPTQYVGPARYQDPPCKVSELPDIHICCISHDHYDHLDYYTIMDLWKYHQTTIHFLVPLGLRQWFISSGIPSTRITELDWWHETIISFPPLTNPDESFESETTLDEPSSLNLKFAFTPAQHRSGRGLLDHMTTLWGSWYNWIADCEMHYCSDTGYRYATALEGDDDAICPAFEEIASYYSPFTLSLLPLSTGSSLPFLRTVLSLSLDQYTLTSSLHCSPLDSLEIHRIIQSERSLGIHWGTFCDLDEARGTRVDFGRCRRKLGVSGDWDDEGVEERKGRFVVGDIGETFVLPKKD